ncbi:conserved exported hypothetical protein [Frankia sp. AiPs1]|uniref:hypothetical protein n=1 Tax=Frankia sp. AiPa1 TaxID=573492 RepID=UPI00202BA452|nr:hypothetical protein [Frankia sp. AiPa1]MCL9760013.1 hypothetical protein [Frankia sp. AiPa1]
MTARLALPARRLAALALTLALAVGFTVAAHPPAARAATVNCGTSHPYAGNWHSYAPDGRLVNIIISFTDCDKWSTASVRVIGRPWLGLPNNNPFLWKAPDSVRWGYVGVSLTVTFRYNGLTESVFITPAQRWTGLPATLTQHFSNGKTHTYPRQYLART